MLVTIIGLSSLTAVRVKLRAAEGSSDAAMARLYAQSAVDVALLKMYDDATWRDTTTKDAWQATVVLGEGSFSWKVTDETNPAFTTDRNSLVRAFGKGVCGDSVWVFSVLVQPPLEVLGTRTELLVNGSFESGTTGWIGNQCSLSIDTSGPQAGAASLLASSLIGANAGPEQSVLGSIESGKSYTLDLWVCVLGQPDTVTATLWIDTSDGSFPFTITQDAADGVWTQLTGEFAPTWTGTVASANLSVTVTSGNDFKIDDAQIWEDQASRSRAVGPILGTWRREPQ
jgi:hypothetical protein